MNNDIKQSLNKHEMILERYKSLLFSDKNKILINNNNDIKEPLNESNTKSMKIIENFYSGKNLNKINNLNSEYISGNKSDKKIEDILNRANYVVFENPNKNETETKCLSTKEKVKKIIEENNKNKISETKKFEKVSELIKKYETKDMENKSPKNATNDHKGYLENLKKEQHVKNASLNNIIEKNSNLIEDLKKKYLNNIKQNTILTPNNNYISANELKFPIQKTFKENETENLSFSNNSNLFQPHLSIKPFYIINANSKKYLDNKDVVEINDKEEINNQINLIKQKYSKDERSNSNIDINKYIQTDSINNLNNDSYLLNKNPEINSIINKYKTKIDGNSNSLDITNENLNLNNINNILNEKNITNNSSSFKVKLEEANKKIDNINFTFQKDTTDFLNLKKKENEEENKNNNESIINQIINKNIESEKKEAYVNEKSKFDFIFKNKENIENLLFKFKLKEKFCVDENKENYFNQQDEENHNNKYQKPADKKGFIKKINFIEEKLNRIENLINFEENEILKNSNISENKNNNIIISSNKIDFKESLKKYSNENSSKCSNENEYCSDYPENFTLGHTQFKNEIKNCKKSVFSDLNKNDDVTTDDEKQSNIILSFAQNIRNLKELKEKNNLLLEERGNKYISKKDEKRNKIPINKKKNKAHKSSDHSDNNLSDRSDFESINLCIINKNSNEKKNEYNSYAKKKLNNFIEYDNIFNEDTKDFIDHEIELERNHFQSHLKKSIDGNPNNSGINNMTLSYSISSNENSLDDNENEEYKNFIKMKNQKKTDFISNHSDEHNDKLKNGIIYNDHDTNEDNSNHKSFDQEILKTMKNKQNRSKSNIPVKNLMSFDEFLNSN